MKKPAAPNTTLARTIIAASLMAAMAPAFADATYQTLPFSQDWSNTSLISANDDWSGMPGVIGYRGDNLTSATGTDPQTIIAMESPVDVTANQTAPNTFTTGGVAEFQLTNPTIALTGSGTADAPFVLMHLNTTGQQNIAVAYTLRDLDASVDNAVQQVALQYRVGTTGDFINVPAAYVADATEANTASKTTPISVTLPAAADNQAQLQVRVITTNAAGNDEWVGIDDIVISGSPIVVTNQPIVATCPALSVTQGTGGSVTLTATDADSRVNGISLAGGTASGFTLGSLSEASGDGAAASVDLNVAGSVAAGSYAVGVEFANDEAQTASCTVNVTVSGVTPISAIQGSGSTSPLLDSTVTTQGVVTKVNNTGFFMQDESGDGNDETSDGIFVYTSTMPTVVAGDRVSVTAKVVEYAVGTGAGAVANPLTELGNTPVVTRISSGATVQPKTITFPEEVEGDLERYEGMLVQIDGPLTIGQNYFLGRYGQLTVTAGERLEKPTNRYPAGSAEALAMADDNARRRILLDDGSSLQNPSVIPYLGADNTVRAGDTIDGLTGVIDYGLATSDSTGGSDFRIHPTVAPAINRANARSGAPEAVGGNVRVASFNVLNYFTTIDQAGASCAPSGTRSDCRGADSAAEFTRQKAKIVSAIVALNADVVGLMEIENNGNTAVLDLVAGLNTVAGAGTYASVAQPTGGTGTDAIRVAMIYKPAKVTPVGNAVSDTDSKHNRPPLIQTFAAANGEKFSVVVNHFKSKSSCPTDSSANTDQGQGQGCWNALRTEQAQALRGTIAALQASTGDSDVIVIGDLNAYGKEDPILDFTGNGYFDQIARFNDAGYSYVFDGETGYLDHALATVSLNSQIVGAKHWRINADEPTVIDYNLEFKQPACATCSPDYYAANAYRSSDHDPVVIGLNLVKTINGSAGRDALVGTTGDDVITGGIGADVLTGGAGADQFVFASLRDGVDTLTDFQPGSDRIVLSVLLRSLGLGGDPLAAGYVTCKASGSDALIGIDTDGAGSQVSRNLLLVRNQPCATLMSPGNFGF